MDESQRANVEAALTAMSSEGAGGAPSFLAVRSSSPEEDLAGMSFAGGYETVLGVRAEVFWKYPLIVSTVRKD